MRARRESDEASESGTLGLMSGGADLLIGLAKGNAAASDPLVRQDLARLYTLGELGRFNALRLKAAKQSGRDIPGMPNIAKLSMSQIVRLSRDLGLGIIGAGGMLHAYDDAGRRELARATGTTRRCHGHRTGPAVARALHLRWDRPDPAQHHR